MSTKVNDPFPVISDLDGTPLEGGYVYIGQIGLDPEAFPVAAFWDRNLTVPASQPIRTLAGRFVDSGAQIGNVYVEGSYSITVKDVNMVTVYSADFDTSDDGDFTQEDANAIESQKSARFMFGTIATMNASSTPTYTAGQIGSVVVNDVFRAGPYLFKVAASSATDQHITLTESGVKLYAVPGASGKLHADQFGVTMNDRASATSNVAKINLADTFAASLKVPLVFGSGIIFFNDRLNKAAAWVGQGGGNWDVHPAIIRPIAELQQPVAPTQFVAVGTFPTNLFLPGVSDGVSMGANRINPSARGSGWNDAEYRWPSMMMPNGTLLGISIAILDTSSGCKSSGFRVLPDFGGDDGQDGYEVTTENGRSTAEVDFGIVYQNVDNSIHEDVKAVGHWRKAGRAIPAVALWDGVGVLPANNVTPYNVTFNDCHFQGYVGSYEVGSETYQVVSVSGSTLTVPWSSRLTLRDSAVWDTVRYNTDGGFSSINIGPNITSVAQDADPSFALVTFDASVSGIISAGDTLIVRPFGGGNSHIVDSRVTYQGFTFSNGAMAHDQNNVAAGQAFPYPSIGFVLSGFRATERVMNDCKIQHVEEVAFMVHDQDKTIMRNLEVEKISDEFSGDRSIRAIVSPAPADNTHHPYPSGGTFQFEIEALSSMRFPGHDWGPAIPVSRAATFDGPGDNGFFEPNNLVFSTYSGSKNWNGARIAPFVGQSAGIYKAGHPSQSPAFVWNDATQLIEGYGDVVVEAENFDVQADAQLTHTLTSGGATDQVVDTQKAGMIQYQSRLDPVGVEIRYLWSVDGGATAEQILKYEGGSTLNGWNFEAPVYLTEKQTKTYRPYITGMTFGGAGGTAYRFDGEVAEFQLLDDSVATITMSADAENLVATITSNSNSGEWGLIKCKTDASPGGVAMAKSTNFTFRNPATALAGSTGTDGHLTFSPRQGSVQIENRTGSTKQFMFSMVAGLGE